MPSFCQITPTFFPYVGGVANYVFRLSVVLSKHGNKVIVISTRPLRKAEQQIYTKAGKHYRTALSKYNIGVYSLDSRSQKIFYFLKFFYYLFKLRNGLLIKYVLLSSVPYLKTCVRCASDLSLTLSVIEKYKIDVIIGHAASYAGLVAFIVGRLLKKPQFTLLYGGALFVEYSRSKWSRKRIEFVLQNTPLFLSFQDNTTERALALGVPKRKIIKTMNCVDTVFFRPLHEAEIEKNVLQAEPENKMMMDQILEFKRNGGNVVLYLGLMEKAHGLEYLIQSLSRLSTQIENVLLLLVGPDYEGIWGELRKLARELKCLDKVRYLGVVPYELLPIIYNLASVVVLPPITKTSALHLAALEAQACGRPIVASIYAGLPEVVKNGKSGIIVDPHSIKELTEAIIQLLQNTELAEKLGRGGRKYAKRHSWDRMAQKINSIRVGYFEK